MIRGLYTSTLGMMNTEKKMEVISNNLANVNTNGFKKDQLVSKSFSDVMTEAIRTGNDKEIGTLTLGVGADEVVTNYSQGSLISTSNPLDLAIKDADLAFFCVEVKDGQNAPQELYTRDGGFTINSLGQLSTKDGNLIKGENGAIALNGGAITVTNDGSVLEDGQLVDKLLIKQFENSDELKKIGNNLISNEGTTDTVAFSGQIIQGSVEASNINSITEMVDMINVMRTYEANQKILKSQDETLGKAVNDVGRI